MAKHGMAIIGPLLAASRVIKAKSAWGIISTSQMTSPDVAHSQDVGAPMDTHLRSQLLQTKHSQRWSLHPGPRSQELSRPFSRRHCLVLNRCCLPPAPKVPSSSAAFEPGRQTSFARLFKVSQVHAHKHARSHTHTSSTRTFTHTHTQAQQWGGQRGTPEQSKASAGKSYGYAQPLVLEGLPFPTASQRHRHWDFAFPSLVLSIFSVPPGRWGGVRQLQKQGPRKGPPQADYSSR